jgi:ribosome recycling factor
MTEHPIVKEAHARMKKAVDFTLHEFSSIHTGKASPTMVEDVHVEAYGTSMRLKDCAAITTPDARLIRVQPWDKSILRAIEKAIQTANLGINPVVEGDVVRLPLPEMSRERRQDLVKTVKHMAENGRVHVRNGRRDAMELVKKAKADGKVSDDDARKLEKEIQGHTDRLIAEIEKHLAAKEKDLLTV